MNARDSEERNLLVASTTIPFQIAIHLFQMEPGNLHIAPIEVHVSHSTSQRKRREKRVPMEDRMVDQMNFPKTQLGRRQRC